MNKFAKTCYPWQGNHKNFIKAVQSKGQNYQLTAGHEKVSGEEIVQNKKQEPYQNVLDKKLQIDPSLLFNKKNARNTNNLQQKQSRRGQRQKQMSSTSTGGFYKPSRERPQSKQQSRIKILKKNASLEKPNKEVERPQTSKGQRNIVYNRDGFDKKKKTLGNQEQEVSIEIKRTVKTATGGRRTNHIKQLELQSSIDPEFLALFAS